MSGVQGYAGATCGGVVHFLVSMTIFSNVVPNVFSDVFSDVFPDAHLDPAWLVGFYFASACMIWIVAILQVLNGELQLSRSLMVAYSKPQTTGRRVVGLRNPRPPRGVTYPDKQHTHRDLAWIHDELGIRTDMVGPILAIIPILVLGPILALMAYRGTRTSS